MAITGIEKTDLAVLFGNSDFRIYQIERDLELEKLILEKAMQFWQNHVLADVAPAAQTTNDYQKLFRKETLGKTVEANSATVELIERLHVLNRSMDSMQDAQILRYQDHILATWKAPKPSYRLDSKRLEAEHPDLTTQYQMEVSNTRRLVIKELKSENPKSINSKESL